MSELTEDQLLSRVEAREDQQYGGHETSFCNAQSDTDSHEIGKVVDEGAACRYEAEGDDDAGDPDAGTDTAEDEVARNLDARVGQIEYRKTDIVALVSAAERTCHESAFV